ncbi:hypothetical protein ACGRHY_14555 [Streptomyces sp. HK10]|uniref:hypothetical protein n=1 Tax=Streptomyces sp. HK10 TaxID=3373255 RepID=UPI003748160D
MSNPPSPTWRWQDGNDTVTATWRSGGWPRHADEPNGRTEPCRSTLDRRAAALPPCRLPAEWKVERKNGRTVRTSWYCVRDLPSTEAPPVDAEEIR